MHCVRPLDQLLSELNRLPSQDREILCIALVCLLRFGMKQPIADLLDLRIP